MYTMKANFSIERFADNVVENIIQKVINAFLELGERCVAQARDKGSYQDRTGNLRNSIGYVVLRDGVKVGGSNPIRQEGKKFLEELSWKYRNGIVLIIVAGMNYATYVEARNYDVLTSAELLAERLVPKLLKDLGFSVE